MQNRSSRPQVFRSEDGGATWAPAVGGLPERGSLEGLAVGGPSEHRTLVLLVDRFRIFASIDGGETWEERGSEALRQLLGKGFVAQFDLDVEDPQRLYLLARASGTPTAFS